MGETAQGQKSTGTGRKRKKKEEMKSTLFPKQDCKCESEEGAVGTESLSCALLEREGPYQGLWEKGLLCQLAPGGKGASRTVPGGWVAGSASRASTCRVRVEEVQAGGERASVGTPSVSFGYGAAPETVRSASPAPANPESPD